MFCSQEILPDHVYWQHPLDRGLLLPDGLVVHRRRERFRNSPGGKSGGNKKNERH